MPVAKIKDENRKIKNMYDNSFPNNKKAWRHLVAATEEVGWKDMYFMILELQELTSKGSGYRLRKTPNI